MALKQRVSGVFARNEATTSFRTLPARILVFLLFLSASTFGQYHTEGVPEIINFTKSDYRAGTQSWSITQDNQGVLYFANNKGVLMFDATEWRLAQIPNQTIVRSLASSPEGVIYVGAQNELGVLTPFGTGGVRYQSLIEAIPEDLISFEDIWKIFPGEDEVLFCSQKGILHWRNNEWEVLRPTGRFENFFQINGRLIAQDIGRGLVEWQGNGFELISGGDQFDAGRIAEVLKYSDDTLLIVSEDNGLFLSDTAGIRRWVNVASDFLIRNKAYCAISLEEGGFAFGTVQDGLLVIDNEGTIQVHINKSSGLQNNTILSLFQDKQSNFWLGLDNGIDYVMITGPFSVIRSEAGIDGTGYASIVHDGYFYIGTNQGLFYRPWSETPAQRNPSGFEKVRNLEGQIWGLNTLGDDLVVCAHEGAFLIEEGRAYSVSPSMGVWKFLLLHDHPGFAVAGTYTGLILFQEDPDALGGWRYVGPIEGFNESARVMAHDQEGYIWISHTYKGLYKLKLSDDLQEAEVFFYDTESGLPTDISINVAKVRGEVIFTTPKGVYLYESNQDAFVSHENFNEVLGGPRHVNRLIEDQNGRIWFSVDEEFGMLKVAEDGFLKEVQLERFYFNHIQEQLVDGFENIYSYGDDVFLGTENGVLHYNPKLDKSKELEFEVLIREVSLLVDAAQGSSGKVLPSTGESYFFHTENAFRFVFAAPFFESIGSLEYRYRLEGFSEVWSEWDRRTEKEFTNLSHGDYVFHVEARNAYGQISAPDSFVFTINPPWYATNIVRVIYLIAGVALIIGLFWLYTKKIEKEREAILDRQNQHLEQKEALFKEEKERSEAEIIRLKNENLRAAINHKTSELASATMHLVQKGEILVKVKQELDKIRKNVEADSKRKVQQLIRMIDEDIRLDNNWEQFEVHFDQVHENFLRKLREEFPQLTPKDQKLCAYLRMNLATKEIAPLMNISVRGVEIARYRLRKKLELDTETNLVDFIMKFRWD